jgi:hypothetical protein
MVLATGPTDHRLLVRPLRGCVVSSVGGYHLGQARLISGKDLEPWVTASKSVRVHGGCTLRGTSFRYSAAPMREPSRINDPSGVLDLRGPTCAVEISASHKLLRCMERQSFRRDSPDRQGRLQGVDGVPRASFPRKQRRDSRSRPSLQTRPTWMKTNRIDIGPSSYRGLRSTPSFIQLFVSSSMNPIQCD